MIRPSSRNPRPNRRPPAGAGIWKRASELEPDGCPALTVAARRTFPGRPSVGKRGLSPDDRPLEPSSAAQARLGFEGLSRLRARHAEVLARISEKVTDTGQA